MRQRCLRWNVHVQTSKDNRRQKRVKSVEAGEYEGVEERRSCPRGESRVEEKARDHAHLRTCSFQS